MEPEELGILPYVAYDRRNQPNCSMTPIFHQSLY